VVVTNPTWRGAGVFNVAAQIPTVLVRAVSCTRVRTLSELGACVHRKRDADERVPLKLERSQEANCRCNWACVSCFLRSV
jgi:hypothetical protein